jgi:hypothetical protein
MGYYKQQAIEQDVDRIVAWYGAHDKLPVYIMNRILADKKLLEDLVEAWEIRESHPTYTGRKYARRRETYVSPNKFTRDQKVILAAVGVIWLSLLVFALIGLYS